MLFRLSEHCLPVTGRHVWRRILCGLALVFALCGASAAQFTRTPDPQLEYRVKAGFLFNFLKFTEWPAVNLPAGQPFRIGVLASPAVHALIAEQLKDKTVGGRAVEVVDLPADAADISCHLLFLPRSSEVPLAQLTDRLGSTSILLVGETEGFAAAGGMIGFVIRGDNVRFQVNLRATQRAGLRLSARLANLAELVKPAAP